MATVDETTGRMLPVAADHTFTDPLQLARVRDVVARAQAEGLRRWEQSHPHRAVLRDLPRRVWLRWRGDALADWFDAGEIPPPHAVRRWRHAWFDRGLAAGAAVFAGTLFGFHVIADPIVRAGRTVASLVLMLIAGAP